MERAGKTLAKSGALTTDELACAAWIAAVGKRIAAHAVPRNLVRGSLIVDVDDAVWQKQLFHLRFQILGKLAAVVGAGVIQDLEFRMATPRRPPQPAQRLQETVSTDEADQIEDAGMRMVYKRARNKASA